MAPSKISRRTFALGVAGANVAAIGGASLAAAPNASAKTVRRPFFDETVLWDAETGPHENYHVHGIAVTPADTILAFTEGRHEVCDAGPRDIVLRRSTDAGGTWTDSQIVVPSVDGESWGNPTTVIDHESGEIFLFYGLSLQDEGNTTCSGDRQEIYVRRSVDDGQTWSEQVKLDYLFAGNEYDWTLHSPGPSHGIQLASGRLLVQVSHRREVVGHSLPERLYGVSTIYSDDHGETWQAGGAIPVDVDYPINESRIWQRADGAIVVNGRSAAGGHRHRISAVSDDDGTSWSKPVLEPATGVFTAVDAGFIRFTWPDGVGRVLHSRPDSARRENLTLSVSYDDGYTYRYSKVVNPGPSYYSDLATLSDGTVVLIYGKDGTRLGSPQRVAVAAFNLAWATDGRDDGHSETGFAEREFELAGESPVHDDNARGGAYARHVVSEPGDFVEFPFELDRTGNFDVAVRYHRDQQNGRVRVSIDGTDLQHGLVDPTIVSHEAFQTYQHGRMRLAAGEHRIRFTLVGPGHLGGTTIAADHVTLTIGGRPNELVRDVVIDDESKLGFEIVSGTWRRSTGIEGHPYYGVSYRNAPAGTGDHVVSFRPDVPVTDTYEVLARWVSHANRASNAPYTIHHSAGSSTVRVDQRVRGSEWVSLGAYRFEAGMAATIDLTNDADGYVIADAVRLTRVTH